MIETDRLTFKYQGTQKSALDDVSLKIETGDFVGIIGESGSGKTTLCSCINGLIPHHFSGDYYGSVKIDSLDTFDINAGKLALKVGSVFQDIESQIVSNIVEDEILFGLENFGIHADQIDKRITESLNELRISDLRYREISSLSGGQKQKVVIASILALKPEILILDEPTGELDPASTVQLFELLKKLNQENNITIVIAEQKIMMLCEYVKKLLILENGKVLHYGNTRDTLTHQKELEEAGINCPRVLTLTKALTDEGYSSGKTKCKSHICITPQEAADFIKTITG